MADFLTHLAGRTLGVVPLANPLTAPIFAPEATPFNDMAPETVWEDAPAARPPLRDIQRLDAPREQPPVDTPRVPARSHAASPLIDPATPESMTPMHRHVEAGLHPPIEPHPLPIARHEASSRVDATPPEPIATITREPEPVLTAATDRQTRQLNPQPDLDVLIPQHRPDAHKPLRAGSAAARHEALGRETLGRPETTAPARSLSMPIDRGSTIPSQTASSAAIADHLPLIPRGIAASAGHLSGEIQAVKPTSSEGAPIANASTFPTPERAMSASNPTSSNHAVNPAISTSNAAAPRSHPTSPAAPLVAASLRQGSTPERHLMHDASTTPAPSHRHSSTRAPKPPADDQPIGDRLAPGTPPGPRQPPTRLPNPAEMVAVTGSLESVPARRSQTQAETQTIRVNIGRVEVKTPAAPARPTPAPKSARPGPALGLGDYLKQRGERRR